MPQNGSRLEEMTREDYGSTDTLAWRRRLAECLKTQKDGKHSRTASLRLSSVVFYSALALKSLIHALPQVLLQLVVFARATGNVSNLMAGVAELSCRQLDPGWNADAEN